MANALHPEALKIAKGIAEYLGYKPTWIDPMASGYRAKLPSSILHAARHRAPGRTYYSSNKDEETAILAKLQAKIDKSPYKNMGIVIKAVGADSQPGYVVPYAIENEHFNINEMVEEIVSMKNPTPKAVKAILRRAFAAGKASK